MDGILSFPTARDAPDSALEVGIDAVLNLLFPETCVVCEMQPVSRRRDCGVCRSCWERAAQLEIRPPWCPSCGLPHPQPAPERNLLCGRCILEPPPFSGARAFGYYQAELGSMVRSLKFRGKRNLAPLLASLMAGVFLSAWKHSDVDLVVPVPLHRGRERERGFNQAAALGSELSRRLGLRFECRALRRIRATPPQVGLSDLERRRNLRGAFRCQRREAVSGSRVLLVDDVMTTGATAASVADALLEQGARRVSVLTVARTVAGLE